jgi:hypothetical protein
LDSVDVARKIDFAAEDNHSLKLVAVGHLGCDLNFIKELMIYYI